MADNMVTLVGTIGTEPELRTTPNGSDVVNFTLATTERTKNAEGKWVDGATSWFRIAVWNTLGRNAHASLHKGQRVLVQGVLRISEFSTEANGTSRRAEVRALAIGHELTFGTSAFAKNGAAAAAAPAAQAVPLPPAPAPEVREPVPAGGGWSAPLAHDDEVPF